MDGITLEARLSQKRKLFIVAMALLVWRPGFLGSETITLTTYYPAPYGGYVSLLSTNNTFLARDAGNLVVGGSGAGAVDRLTVYGGGTAMTAVDGGVRTRFFSASSTGQGYVGTSSNHNFVIRTGDADRMTVTNGGQVNMGGSVWLGGSLLNTCFRMWYSQGGWTTCPGTFPYVTGSYGAGGGDDGYSLGADIVYRVDNAYTGYMTCCRMSM